MGKAPGKKKARSFFPQSSESAITKEAKHRNKRQGWAQKLGQLQQTRQREEQSKKAPLNHFELLQDSIASISAEMHADIGQPPSKADLNRNRVRSAGGRSATLFKEREHFKQVLRHPAFQKDPVGTIHKHLTYALAHDKI